MKKLDTADRRLLTLVQQGIPLVSRPFRELGERLGLNEDEVVDRLVSLKENGYIRRFGGIFDTPSLGFAGTLVAMAVPPERLDEVGERVSGFAGVTHNYARDHERYNLWFTLISRDKQTLHDELERIVAAAGIEDYLVLPTVRVFKIGAKFNLAAEEESDEEQG